MKPIWRISAVLIGLSATMAAAQPMTILDAAERLQRERHSAVVCAQVMKRHLPKDDAAAYSRAELAYEAARTEVMAAIARLEAALIEGQEEEGLDTVTDGLERGRELREKLCADALALMPPASGQRDPIEAVLNLVGSLVEAATTIWSKSKDLDATRRNNLRTALQDAKWPAFKDI